MQDWTIGIGHNTPPGPAGRARAATWVLTFDRETPPEREPPMGWTGGRDTLAAEVVLTFPTRAQAVAYAERQGLAYRVEPDPAGGRPPGTRRGWRAHRVSRATPARPQVPAARDRSAGGPVAARLPDLERALVNPAAVFDTPGAVRDHPRLLPSCKREILRRWAWDEYLKEVAAAEGMAEGEPSRLDAVKAALLALGEAWRPDPAAPAAAIPAPGAVDRAAA
ncbi:ETC complex I subunit [Methylobacterium sp. NMS14P]|uniref:NADH dehydrogenase ubiquinone Fe-S protein 4 n=1 Tax=Methylobacterium sp. NMS14P TaxID=2894310 RepID=UPI002358F255|nr:NADH dehydrogenase ubiquinone Fe-S protein 4 [Methylobacterium sp. NMS14P]WCS23877.1 ETC complex I subunit [Methylobacterium sp. NMS14P]